MGKKLNRDALESLLTRIPVVIFSLLHSVLLIRLLGPEGNGLYTYIMAGISLCIVVTGFDAKRSTVFHMIRPEFDTAKIMGLTVKVYLTSIVLVASFIIFIYLCRTEFSYLFIPKEYFVYFYGIFFILSFVFQHLTELCKSFLQAFKAFRDMNRYLLITNFVQVVLYASGYFLVAFRGFDAQFSLIFLVILAVQLLALLYAYSLVKKNYGGRLDYKSSDVKSSFLRYTGKGYAAIVGHFLNKRLMIWFVEFYSGLASLGIYALASQLSNFMLLATAPIEEVLRTYLISYDRKEGNVIFVRYFKLVFYLIIFLALVLFILGPFAINLVFGSEFSFAAKPLRILCLGTVFLNVKTLFLNYNRAYDNLYYNIWAQWAGVIATILLAFLLVPSHGIVGAAWATSIAYVISGGILMTIFMYQQKVPPWKLLIPSVSDVRSFTF